MCLRNLLAAWTGDAVAQDRVSVSRGLLFARSCIQRRTISLSRPLNPTFPPLQRALLEQKQRRKRQEPLMVQPNTEARPRRARTRRGEEQAPLVESQLNVTNDALMEGEDGSGLDHDWVALGADAPNDVLVPLQASTAPQLSWKPPNWE